MLSEKMQQALNDQVNMEFGAYYVYLSMSSYFEDKGLPGFAAWMNNHAAEELTHAMKIFKYIQSRMGRALLQTIDAPATSWKSPLDAFEDAFRHERAVTISIGKLVDLARAESDHASESFLKWFVDEQVEEEELVDGAIQKLKLVGDTGHGLYMLDKELAAEVPAPAEPAE